MGKAVPKWTRGKGLGGLGAFSRAAFGAAAAAGAGTVLARAARY